MSGLFCGNNFVSESIGTSRTFHEIFNVQGGNTKYGVMASLISNNIVTIDEFAKYFAGQVGALVTSETYKDQYNQTNIAVFDAVARNFHSKRESEKNETKRALAGGIASGATELAIKLGARGLAAYLQKQENFETYSQVYRLLHSYVYTKPFAESCVNNTNRAGRELLKIRRQFRLSDEEQRKIIDGISVQDQCLDSLDLPVIDNFDSTTRENMAYLLSALHFQKFEDDERNDPLLLEYYDFLGFHGNYAKELAREQKNNYIYVSNEQNAYLTIARGMVTQFDIALPSFDLNELMDRSREMAKFDPYKFKSKKKAGQVSNHQKTVADIYYKRPDYILNAAATAVAQFSLNDAARDFIERKLLHWGVEDTDRDTIFTQGDRIKSEATNSSTKDEE